MRKFLIFISLFCIAGAYAQKDTTQIKQKPIIVISSSPDSEAPERIQKMFIKRLSEGLLKSNLYEIAENREVGAKVTAQEQGAYDAGMVENMEQKEISGHARGADYTIYVSIFEIFGQYDVSCTVMKYGTQTLLQSFNVKEKKDIFKAADELSNTLARSTDLTKVIKTGAICSKCCFDENTGESKDCEISIFDEKPRTYQEAMDFALEKGAGWRLPTKEEIRRIFSKQSEIADMDFVRLNKGKDYWTSDTFNNYESWAFNFSTYSELHYSKNIKNIFRCIRPLN
ncbi:MAG: DUF1566 domain-containing protein [Paludibacter sp.]|nr:DUF1566 domain-containing protein [Paludibacter sp.]